MSHDGINTISTRFRQDEYLIRGDAVVDATTWSAAPGGWSGSLEDFAVRSWVERDSNDAAIVTTRDGQARAWINLHHANTPTLQRLVWLWCQYTAYWRGADRLPADKLANIRGLDRQEA